MTLEQKRLPGRPRSTSLAEQEMDKAQVQLDAFENNVKELTLDRMNEAPVKETEPNIKISTRQAQNSKDIYLKPEKTFPPGVNPRNGQREVFNEKWRAEYDYSREYVRFTAYHNEIIGEAIEFDIKKFPGTPVERWKVPTGVAVWAPRVVAERIKGARYHRLVMKENNMSHSDGMGQYFGTMAADSIIQRLDAMPVSENKSIFMGAGAGSF